MTDRRLALRLTPPLRRILLTNVAPSFVGSALLLFVTELREAHLLRVPEVSLVMSAVALATFVGPLTAGLLSRRLPSRALMRLAALLYLVSLGLLGSALSVPMLAASFLLGAFAYSLVLVTTSAELAAGRPDDTHTVIALQLAAGALGGIVAPPAAAWVFSWSPVAASSRPALPVALLALLVVLLCLLPALVCGDYRAPASHRRGNLPWRLWPLWPLLMLAGLHGACDLGSWPWMPIWLQDRGGAGRGQIAALLSLTWIGSLAGRGLSIALARRFGTARAVRLGATGATIGILCTVLIAHPAGMIGSYSFYCLCAAGNLPGLMALVSRHLPQWRAEVTGLLMAVLHGSGSLASLVTAQAAAASGRSFTAMPLAVVAMALFASVVLTYRRLWTAPESPAQPPA